MNDSKWRYEAISDRPMYNVGTLPIRISENGGIGACPHFHDDYEFISVISGTLTYLINGEEIVVPEGRMLLINSGQMHAATAAMLSPRNGKEQSVAMQYSMAETMSTRALEYHTMTIHPSLFFSWDSLHKFYEELSGEGSPAFFLFSPGSQRHREIIDAMGLAYILCQSKRNGYELELVGMLFHMCNRLMRYIGSLPKSVNASTGKLEIVRNMIGYVQTHYKEKMTIKTIAEAGGVCRSRGCELFKEVWRTSPNDYLTDYRLMKSVEMMELPECTIVEAAKNTGFHGASYYSETFKKKFGITPTEFREHNRFV